MKVAIVGYAKEGKTSATYWSGKGDEVVICDQSTALEASIPSEYGQKLGDDYLANLNEFDLIVRTAGLHPQIILNANPDHPEIKDKITTNVSEFIQVSPSRNMIAITGTKGKGTTSTFITKILEAAGKKAHLGGNIGVAMLGLLPDIQPDDYVVLELSSFQLYDLKKSVPTAVCLTVSPEHLNWHKDLEDYMRSKGNLFRLQTEDSLAVYNVLSETSTDIAGLSPGKKATYEVPPLGNEPIQRAGAYIDGDMIMYRDTDILSIKEVAIPGRHNLENICAAIAAVWGAIDGNVSAIQEVLRTFSGLEEHLELIREVDGVKYYNDTYATAPDAALAAMNAFEQDKVMILGGIDKQVDLEPMVDAITKSNVRGVVLIDDLADKLAGLFAAKHFENAVLGGPTMTEIVGKAKAMARPGDVVLLSPGCAGNGGMFIDKNDRGHQFDHAVEAL